MRNLRPDRRTGVRTVPSEPRATALLPCASGAVHRALAGPPLCRVQRPAARVRNCSRGARLRGVARAPSSRPGRSAGVVTSRRSRRASSSRSCRGPTSTSITFVPGDRDRGLQRGHVPAAALAARAGGALVDSRCTMLLARRPGIGRQRDLPRADRRRNVAHAFTAREPVPGAHLPRRRRLHDGLDGDCVRDGASSRRGTARGRRLPREGGAIESGVDDHEREGDHAAQAHRPSRPPRRQRSAVRRTRSSRSSTDVSTI